MHLPIYGLLWYFFSRVGANLENGDDKMSINNKYSALMFNLQLKKLDDIKYLSNSSKGHHYFTACPAASIPKQIKFNEDFSITKESIFLKKIHFELDLQQNICEKPLKPVTVYHSKLKEYLIGYELYCEDGALELESGDYENLRQVNTENNTICPQIQLSSNIIKYQDRNNTKFYFTNGSPTLVFHWIPVLAIQYWPPNTKQINFGVVQFVNNAKNPIDEYKDYKYLKDKNIKLLYSEKTQTDCLKDILPPPPSSSVNNSESCGQIYGCFKKMQIIPSWFYKSSSQKLASYSSMNFIPVWKSIAKQLEIVDRSVYAFAQFYRKDPLPGIIDDVKLIFGISGVVKMNTSKNPNQLQEIHLTNPKNNQTTPIPKIIYRIIGYNVTQDYYSRQAILIHNDPSAVLDRDRLCTEKEELEMYGYSINNKDSRTGLTYVCPGTKKLYKKLGIQEPEEFDDNQSSISL